MNDRSVEAACVNRLSGEARRKERNTLGLRAFERISAVEGIRLSPEMRQDLQSPELQNMDEGQRSRFIMGKYARD